MDLIFWDNYEENDIWHDKLKNFFFLSYVDFFSIFTGLARPLSIGLKEKYPVKTDTIENNISLRVICETIFLYFVAKWGTLFSIPICKNYSSLYSLFSHTYNSYLYIFLIYLVFFYIIQYIFHWLLIFLKSFFSLLHNLYIYISLYIYKTKMPLRLK